MAKENPIAFKAEIKQLLNILIHSLYTDRDIFLRELISNASDALTQLEFLMLTDRDVLDADRELAIRIEVDEKEKQITISDSGIGMNRDELAHNLGTIAQSGAKAFMEAADSKAENLADVIGQFGVGFYSVFMVAEWVRVTSRSYRPDDKAASWYATGGDTFTVSEADKSDRGTTIEIKLKEDAKEFASDSKIRETIKKHSDYVRFPIFVGEDEEQSNRQNAIWRQSAKELEDEEYQEFYRHLTLEFEPPITHIHFAADAPIQMYSLLYFPQKAERGMFSLRKEDGLKLYARKVLIQEYSTELLPPYYRFIHGVVDAEDIPLNVSRESVQANRLMARIKKILTNQVNTKLKDMAKNDPDSYANFWKSFGLFIKEGIATVEEDRESLYPFLRFHTTKFNDTWESLNSYIGRMNPDQKKIYYILGDDARSVLRSPHLDYFQKHDYEVITFTHQVDSFMLLGLRSYEGFDLQNVADPDLELPKISDDEPESEEAAPDEDQVEKVVSLFKEILGERITDVKLTDRLTDSMARLVDPEGSLDQEMQRVYRIVDQDFEVPKKVLEVNPKHAIFSKMVNIDPESDLAMIAVEQIYESALLIEGLHPDPASMLPRIQDLINRVLE